MQPKELARLEPFWAAEANIAPSAEMIRLNAAVEALDAWADEREWQLIEVGDSYLTDALTLDDAEEEASLRTFLMPVHDTFEHEGKTYESQFLVVDARNPSVGELDEAYPDQIITAYFLLVCPKDAPRWPDRLPQELRSCVVPSYIVVSQDFQDRPGVPQKDVLRGSAYVYRAYTDGIWPLAFSTPSQVRPERVCDMKTYDLMAAEVELALARLSSQE